MPLKKSGIDNVDLKIIGHLLEDARKNFVEIAKEVGISKNVAWNRYKKMTKTGIITGSTIQINYKKLGYDCVATIYLDVDPSQIEQASSILRRIPNVFGPYSIASKYNLAAIVTLKIMTELGRIKWELKQKMPSLDIRDSIWTDVWFTPENLSLIPVKPCWQQNKTKNADDAFEADETDLMIINELSKNSHGSFRSLAKNLNISTDTIAKRYAKMKENKVLVARIQIDPSKIGYHAIAGFILKINSENNLDNAIREIVRIPDVFYVMKCVGEHNVLVTALVKNVEDMLRTRDLISAIPGVRITSTETDRIWNKWPTARTYTSTLG